MAKFLRDERIANLTIDTTALTHLAEVFLERGLLMPEYHVVEEEQPPPVLMFYTVRFDEKGYRVFEVNELLNCFQRANEVERVIYDLHSAESIKTNRTIGSYASLRLDNDENTACFLTVDSDDEEWVNGTFSAIREVLQRHKNRHSVFRNPVVDFLVQIFGLVFGFFISLWGATIIAPNLSIDNAFLISFVLVLLLFSNLWGPLKQKLQGAVFKSFPNIKFYRTKQDKSHWLVQALVGGVVVAVALYILSWVFSYIGGVLGVFVQ
jgi:hypothetical protein